MGLKQEQIDNILSEHPGADLSLYKEIIYEDSYCDYSWYSYTIILLGIDGSYHCYESCEGCGEYSPNEQDSYNFVTREISKEEVDELIDWMKSNQEENQV